MLKLYKVIIWILWKCWYLCQPYRKVVVNGVRRRVLDTKRMRRTARPWGKFRPHVFWNQDARWWEVWLEDCGPRPVKCKDITVSGDYDPESGKLVRVVIMYRDVRWGV